MPMLDPAVALAKGVKTTVVFCSSAKGVKGKTAKVYNGEKLWQNYAREKSCAKCPKVGTHLDPLKSLNAFLHKNKIGKCLCEGSGNVKSNVHGTV